MSAGFEIDFIQVGDGERSGDAIAIRYLHPYVGPGVVIVDGGDKAAGTTLANHVVTHFNTNIVDHVINTHPDSDHSSGLTEILERLQVKNLWMHRPWLYASAISNRFRDGRITDASLEERIREALNAAHDVEQAALVRGVPIHEPYQGSVIGPFIVLSPERTWYLTQLVPNFDKTPESKAPARGLLAPVIKAAQEAASWIAETLAIETLDETGETSAENESSVVLYGDFGGERLLLTGDAGRSALTHAANYARGIGASLQNLNCVQVPHHGSRRNVSPSVLNQITAQIALISVAPKSTTHPRRKVTNAFKRRGARVFRTNGGYLNHTVGLPRRQGLVDAPEIPFYDRVEA